MQMVDIKLINLKSEIFGTFLKVPLIRFKVFNFSWCASQAIKYSYFPGLADENESLLVFDEGKATTWFVNQIPEN